jgi:acetate kinase
MVSNRMGIRKGAERMQEQGKISESAMKEIHAICRLAPMHQFKPLLCVISRLEAVPYYKKVDIKNLANPLSHEYIVSDLPQSAFDVIRFS